jgi:large subunit ribosomal protein L15
MAELHDLSPSEGSTRPRKRVGRGQGSGLGKTAGRGQDGQKSRSGGRIRRDFEGGQMPLMRRIPKRGFKNIYRVEYQIVNVRDLARCDGDVGLEALKAAGLIASLRKPVKILGEGDTEKSLNVTAHKFSKSAREKIEAAGGSATVIGGTAEDTS